MHVSITFVCQVGDLEAKALLLAASLRRALTDDVELVACIPHPESRFGSIPADTLVALEALGVRTVPISNPLADDYPIGNKLACLDIPTAAEWRVFLDSDVLLTGPLDHTRLCAGDFAAKPADWPTFRGSEATWGELYDRFALPRPDRRVVATVAGRLMWPYFNAGVIAVRAGRGLGAIWTDTCRAIDADPAIPCRRPHLDQIALPIAVARAGLSFATLPEDLNYPAHLRPVPVPLPTLVHYHEWHVIEREPALLRLVTELVADQPALAKALSRLPDWERLLAACRRPPRPRQPVPQQSSGPLPAPPRLPEGIVTGIPRSGTSHLCRLLDQLEDHAVLNEPQEVLDALAERLPSWRMPVLYREWRRRILAGEPIQNKVVAGQLVDDTLDHNRRGDYRPDVGRDDFVLWTKNTLAYLARLDHLRRVMPEATVVASVRHPCDTIASWIRSFAHLRDAAVETLPVGGPEDPWIDGWQRENLRQIAACTALPLRRALLWRFLAEGILARRHDLAIIRYEDLVADPVGMLRAIAARVPDGPPVVFREEPRPAAPRHPARGLLTPADLECIIDICRQPAHEFGYAL